MAVVAASIPESRIPERGRGREGREVREDGGRKPGWTDGCPFFLHFFARMISVLPPFFLPYSPQNMWGLAFLRHRSRHADVSVT